MVEVRHLRSQFRRSALPLRADTGVRWRKSSFSGQGNCVEIALGDGVVRVRDTKDRAGGELRFTAAEWSAFISGVRAGEFDL